MLHLCEICALYAARVLEPITEWGIHKANKTKDSVLPHRQLLWNDPHSRRLF